MSETNSEDKEVLLTVEQACERLSISRRTFYRLLNADQLKTAKIFLPGTGTSIRGFRALVPCKDYHSAKRQGDVVKEVVTHLWAGKIVILDLSAGPVEVRSVLSKRIAQQIFDTSFRVYNSGKTPQNIVIYVEEAHNLSRAIAGDHVARRRPPKR